MKITFTKVTEKAHPESQNLCLVIDRDLGYCIGKHTESGWHIRDKEHYGLEFYSYNVSVTAWCELPEITE